MHCSELVPAKPSGLCVTRPEVLTPTTGLRVPLGCASTRWALNVRMGIPDRRTLADFRVLCHRTSTVEDLFRHDSGHAAFSWSRLVG